MNFKAPDLPDPWYTPERAEIQAEANRFAMTEVLPVANQLDPVKGEIPSELMAKLATQGYFGIRVAKEHGGMGLGIFEYCMIAEELGRAWMSVASVIARGQGSGTKWGDAANQRALLARAARGEWIGAAGLSEPDAGSDLAGVSTRAVRDEDEWVINGRKRWTGFAKNADFIQLLCRERDPEPGERRAAGLVNIIVPKERGAFPDGVKGTLIDKIGYHGFTTWELDITDLRVPLDNTVTVGNGTAAFKEQMERLNIARVHTAARAVALARAAVEDSVAYLQERRQFDHPLSDFQSLRFMVATMAAKVEQARTFYRQVAHSIDLGLRCEREAAMAKLVASEMAVEVTNMAMQLHGGNGYTTERAVERHWRDARLTTIFEGTSQIQQHIIANTMLPKADF